MSPDNSGNDRYLILLEQIQGQVQMIAEGHEQLNQKIDRVESNLQNQIKNLESSVWLKFDAFDAKFDALDSKIDALEQKLSDKIDAVEVKLSTKIDGVASRLDRRIAVLERRDPTLSH